MGTGGQAPAVAAAIVEAPAAITRDAQQAAVERVPRDGATLLLVAHSRTTHHQG